jgi:hypothetical protein
MGVPVEIKGLKVEVGEGALIVANAVSVFWGLLGVMVGVGVAVGGVPVMLGVGVLMPLVAVAPPPPPEDVAVAVETGVFVAVAGAALICQQGENSEVSIGDESPALRRVAVAVI